MGSIPTRPTNLGSTEVPRSARKSRVRPPSGAAEPVTKPEQLTWRDRLDLPIYRGRATSVLVYPDGETWRTTVVPQKGGLLDGRLSELGLSADEAKAAVLKRLAATDEVEIAGGWEEGSPGWWSAELRFLPGTAPDDPR